MTRLTVLDSSTVTVHGPDSSAVVSGPLTVACESVTVGGLLYSGEVLVNGGSALQTLRFSADQSASLPFGAAVMLVLGLLVSRFRV